jgi:predicted NAD/FAD-binding protein
MFYRTDRNDVIMLPPTHDGLIEWKSFSAQNLLRSIQVKGVLDEGHKIISVRNTATTLRELVDTLKYGQNFKDGFFYPYLASNWGVSPEEIQDFSAYDVLKYMVDGYDSKTYDWYEVEGGLQKYIDIVSGSLRTTKIKLNSRVTQVSQTNNHYAVLDVNGTQQEYDHVIFTTDASVTSALLSHLPLETQLAESLAKVKYYTTKIAIHSDKRFMPPDANDWRVINIRYDGSHAATTVYKSWKSKTPIFKSWITYDVRAPNDKGVAMPSNLYGLFTFNHPIVDHHYFEAQKVVEQLQGNHNLWFAGMWTYNNDSHESAIISAIKIAERLAPNSDRLNILKK